MHIAGQGKGGTYRSFKCAANHSKGPEVCSNGASISERKAHVALVETVRGSLQDERFFERFESTFNKLWREAMRERATAPETAPLDAEIRKSQADVDRLAALAADHTDIEALLRQLRTGEGHLRGLRAHRAAAAARVVKFRHPHPSPR